MSGLLGAQLSGRRYRTPRKLVELETRIAEMRARKHMLWNVVTVTTPSKIAPMAPMSRTMAINA
jgi:hypothetical protein